MKLPVVNTGTFEGFGIVGIDAELISMFGGELTFDVIIDKQGRLRLISKQHVQRRE
ncbi:MAG: hypothetical protein IIC67_11965 [Thaumarchaeota archaeon]|nr:hypothetical protein [Nitrososphaerota archaeon]